MALIELAFTRSLNGHHEAALLELQEAWTEASALNNTFLTATVEVTLGAVYGYIDEFEASIEHYQKGLATYRELDYRASQAEAVNGLGITYRLAEHWDEAIASFQYYRELTEFNANARNRFVSWYGLGMTHAERGDCDAALPAIQEALDADGPEDFRAELYKRRAVCLAEQGEGPQAREALRQAREIFAGIPELQGTRWEIDVKRAEALTLHALGDHEAAFQKLLTYHDQFTKLLTEENTDRLIELRVGMENARKDMEINLLRQQSRVNALELAQRDQRLREQRILSAAMIGLFVMVVLVVLLQWRNARRLRRLSICDELTGLFNRRHLFALLERLVRRLPVERGQLSIILLDVDDFKHINDSYGHPVGDSLLKALADQALPLLRSGDNMARLGGEEFLVVLPRTDSHQACGVARRLGERIRHFSLSLADGRQAGVTVSIGVASFGPDCPDMDSLYSAADRALYVAKSRGKDRVILARPDGDCMEPVY